MKPKTLLLEKNFERGYWKGKQLIRSCNVYRLFMAGFAEFATFRYRIECVFAILKGISKTHFSQWIMPFNVEMKEIFNISNELRKKK